MVGINKEIENFSYIDISALEEKHQLDDSMRDSFKHYNKALDLVKSKSEDIAILEIKRAININPHFNEAQNLLGLLYALTGEEEKAVQVFKNVIAEENNSIKALDYIGKIDGLAAASSLVFTGTDTVSAPKKTEIKKKKPVPEKTESKTDKINNGLRFDNSLAQNYVSSLKYHVLAYAVIFAISALIFSNIPKKANVPANNSEEVAKLNMTVKELTDKNNALTEENNKLKGQDNADQGKTDANKAQTEPVKAQENNVVQGAEKLNEVENQFGAGQYEQAADLLMLLKDVKLNEADKNRYTELVNKIIPEATWRVYSDGMNYFNNQDYKTAIQRLSKSISYGGTYNYTQYSYYNFGRAYQFMGDKDNAIKIYNTIKEKFPDSESAVNAGYRLNELNK